MLSVADALIRIENLTFSYSPERPLFRGIDFELYPGERIGVLGANGSGKSTLLHLIVGLLQPHEGTIQAFGSTRRSEKDFREVRQRAGLLFQDADDQLFCPTVGEDVAFGPLNQGKKTAEVRTIVCDTLKQLGLSGLEDRVTYRLSGGERRLVALAGVLAMQPQVLLLDEPVAALDEAAQDRITEVLIGLPHEMLVISHDRAFLERVTNKTCRISSGRIETD